MYAFSPLLRYFEEVALHGSMRRAADRLHIAPSAVARQVLRFEELLGVPLFERLPRGVRLTSAGELMLASVRRLQQEFDTTLSQVDALKGLRRGKVQLGVLQFMTDRFLPSIISELHSTYPGLSFTVHVGNSDDIPRRVVDGTLDIGMCWAPAPSVPVRRVRQENVSIGLVVQPGHPLASRQTIRFSECVELPLILPTADMELRRMLDNMQSGSISRVSPFVETNSIPAMRELVMNGTGAAIMTRVTVLHELNEGHLVHIPLSDRGTRAMPFCLMVHADRTPSLASALVLEMLTHKFAEFHES